LSLSIPVVVQRFIPKRIDAMKKDLIVEFIVVEDVRAEVAADEIVNEWVSRLVIII